MRSLPLFVNLAGRPVIVLGEGSAAEAKRRILVRAGADVRTDERDEALIAIVALEDEALAHAAVARLKARGMLVNAVDRPSLCDFTLPAIVDRDPVLIAIGTSGASAGLAKALRQRLERLLPSSLGALALALGKARATMHARWPDAGLRRRTIDAALDEGGVLDPLSAISDGDVERWLAAARNISELPSRMESVLIESDDPDDLSLRAARLLGQADMIFYQRHVAPAILVRARADAGRQCQDEEPEWRRPGLALWLRRPPAHPSIE